MRALIYPFAGVSVLLTGALFGFFYAWVCSTMWGLDTVDPEVAIAAMQGMNASVQNAVFAPAFFGTPIALLLTALLCWVGGIRAAAAVFGLGGLIALGGGTILTIIVNVPMNEALAEVSLPNPAAVEIWRDYSAEWQIWNQIRTGFTGLALIVAVWGVWLLGHQRGPA